MKALVLLANGLEEMEAIVQVDFLRRAGIEVTAASIHDDKRIVGQTKIVLEADELLDHVNAMEYDIVVLPGGLRGMQNLRDSEEVTEILKAYHAEKKWIAAICAAPSILGGLGILKDRECICYPGLEDKLLGGKVVNKKVVVDGHIITSKGPGTALDFAIAMIEALCGHEKAADIVNQTLM